MKVEQKKGFSPITITLESEEECEHLWYCLITSRKKKEESALDNGHTDDQIKRLKKIHNEYSLAIWEQFDSVFRPKVHQE